LLDGVGAGEAPDAAAYGDVGSNSLGNTSRAVGGLHLPNMERLGLGHITPIQGVAANNTPEGAYGKMRPRSAGKDSISGHWELMGITLDRPFPTYPNGFPSEVIQEFTRRTGLEVLGNKPASGTEIIKELGEEHLRTGKPIVYTSADSVFQVAANEAVIPLERLYEICTISREILQGEHGVGRVIARPFVGTDASSFQRTVHRRDYPRYPETATIMDKLVASGRTVLATGKTDELFGGRGITESIHSAVNAKSMQDLLTYLEKDFTGLIFTNLVEFDMIYGHRNDARGYAQALQDFDRLLPEVISRMQSADIAMIVADHGVDPTTPSTDHSREYIPLLVFGDPVRANVDLGIRQTFSDVGATLAEIFTLEPPQFGTSFLREII
jgi:phosphopentomutase